jgi:hypothetical protein
MFTNARHIDFYDSLGYSLGIQDSGYGDEEEPDERTKIVYALTEIGTIADFIKAYPMYNFEDYKWSLNPCVIRIMCADNTHILYLSEKQIENKKSKRYDGKNNVNLNDLGIPIIGLNNSKTI